MKIYIFVLHYKKFTTFKAIRQGPGCLFFRGFPWSQHTREVIAHNKDKGLKEIPPGLHKNTNQYL